MTQNSKFKIQNSSQSGFSTLELLIAMAILITTFTAVILVVFSNQTVTTDTEIVTTALSEAKKQIEEAKIQARNDFISLETSTSSFDIFNETLTVNNVNSCRTDITSIIDWSTDPLRPGQISLTTNVINAAEAQALGGDCGPLNPPRPGWQNIVCTDQDGSPSWDFPQDSGIPATGIDLITRSSRKYAVISSQGSAAGKRDFWIVDVTDRASLATQTSTPPVQAIDTGNGLNDIIVSGNYAFATSNTTTKQLQVFDISNLTSPVYIKSASRSLNAVGANSEGQEIFYHNDRVYIGTNYLVSYDEFQVFDVTNPTNPSLNPIGSYNVNHNIYKIVVRNEVISGTPKTLAYLAVSDSVGDKPKMVVLDVTNPASITLFGSYNPTPNSSRYGTALAVLGRNAYLGRQTGSGNHYDLISLNISNPSSIFPADPNSALLQMGPNNDVRGMIASGPYIFIITSDNNRGFQVWGIDDPTDIYRVGECKYPQEALDMEFDGNFAYVVNRSQNALRIIYDATNPFP